MLGSCREQLEETARGLICGAGIRVGLGVVRGKLLHSEKLKMVENAFFILVE